MIELACMVVDDEPLSQEVIVQFIRDTPGLTLERVESDALGALSFLRDNKVDLIFLDINMPKVSGLSFAKSLESPPMIIFTTAYPEYAVVGFDLEAVDYLVKPVPFERFLKAANKAIELYRFKHGEVKGEEQAGNSSNTHITVRSDKKIYQVPLFEISFFESIGDYVKIHTTGKVIIATFTLKDLIEKLNEDFIRIHKSYIVSLSHIAYVEGNIVKIGSESIPIGMKYKEDFFNRFRNFGTS